MRKHMIKNIFLFLILCVVLFFTVKGLFFSGTALNKAYSTSFRPDKEPGFVWASAGTHYKRGWIGKKLLGEHYRAAWETPVRAPILDLKAMHGGFKVGKLGGGQQTTSLNLISTQGQTYTLRSVDKDPIEILPAFWQHTFLANLMRDQISGSNPYGALVAAPLAEAVSIPHANPQLVFVSDAERKLQAYQSRVGNKLFFLEEKYTSHSVNLFPGASTIKNSVEMLDYRFRFQNHQIDQKALAKCRLFDILIGDWDRHEGQWNWVGYPAGKQIIYKPIPKDRDQAFSRFQDGLIPWLITRDFALRKFGHFSKNINTNSYVVNAAFLDERALNALTINDFKQIALELQHSLTDQEIAAAVKRFPPAIYKLVGKDIEACLKSRRQNLLTAATEYYKLLAKKVVVTGTDEKELFKVNRINDNLTLVQIFQLSDTDSVGQLLYKRVFSKRETQEILLHGLAGDDVFKIEGKVKTCITLHINGGLGEDTFSDVSIVTDQKHKTVIYDTKKGNNITWTPGLVDKTTSDISLHNYDREGY